nr:ATPase, F1/V1/A1 complex, alpha/beta subunit, zinc knuckle CX2CX4HX4C [Tanacetum cinerariifolium]
ESDSVGKKVDVNSRKGMVNDGKKGFEGDLNGIQFPQSMSEKVNTEEEEMVKQSGNGDNAWGSVRYHTRRIWNKFGLKDVIAKNGMFYFKFQDEEGINEVINNGPWMINNKPLMVQKWCIDICMDKAEPSKIHVWVKMRNVSIEAWSVKGISALASSIGKPVIMDEVTTKTYVTGIRRIGFARVLVDINAKKGIKDKVKVMYKSKNISEGTKKIVNVEYSWIPSI